MRVDLTQVWRDKVILEEIRAEIRRQNQTTEKWRAWEILLPPDLLYPMLEEISAGTFQQWSPVLDNVGVQVGNQNEVGIRFVLPELKVSPVMLKTMVYIPNRLDNIIPVEVNSGNKIRV